MTREERIALLTGRIAQLGDDEVLILAFVAKRMISGAKQYGAWSLRSDKRNWPKEIGEEMADALNYLAAKDAQEWLLGGEK